MTTIPLALTRIGLALVLGSLLACSGGGHQPRASSTPEPRGVRALDRAIDGINKTRGPLVGAMNAIVVAANHIDAIDAATVKGVVQQVSKVRTDNLVAPTGVTDVVRQLPGLLTAYNGALNALKEAANTPGVPARPAEAMRQVVAVGRAEAAADDAFVRAVVVAWPAYAVLYGLGSMWFERATSGWYSSRTLAAQEYAVLTDVNRSTTGRASRLFASTDEPRREAADTWAETLKQVQPILHPKSS